jgi:hypothetical protein
VTIKLSTSLIIASPIVFYVGRIITIIFGVKIPELSVHARQYSRFAYRTNWARHHTSHHRRNQTMTMVLSMKLVEHASNRRRIIRTLAKIYAHLRSAHKIQTCWCLLLRRAVALS